MKTKSLIARTAPLYMLFAMSCLSSPAVAQEDPPPLPPDGDVPPPEVPEPPEPMDEPPPPEDHVDPPSPPMPPPPPLPPGGDASASSPGDEPPADSQSGADAIPEGQELVNIDFPEPTDIRDIVKAVSLWTGKNVIIDRNVSGKIQIISPRKVTKEQAYQAFLSALNVLQLTTVETGKIIKIMQIRNAIRGNLKTFLGRDWTLLTDEIITQIIPLNYLDPEDMRRTLSSIVSSNSMIAYKPTRTLIMSDSGYKVRRVLDIIKLLDVEGQQPKVSIVPIRFADAKQIADKVNEILRGTGGKSAVPGYKILVDERSNSVVVAGPPRTISDIKELVHKFDIRLDDPSRQSTIHVRPLDYADATKLAATLSALASASGSRTGALRPPPVRRISPDGGGEISSEGVAPSVAALSDDLKITADASSNSLLITGSLAAYRAVNSIIRKLDVKKSQVYVEADILDINVGTDFKAGVSLFSGSGSQDGAKVVTTWEGGTIGPLLLAMTQSRTSPDQTKGALGVFANDLTIGVLAGKSVNVAGIGNVTPGALIKLLKEDTNTRTLSSPHILTANNEESSITVGTRIFYKDATFSAATATATPKLSKEDVNLTLGIKPNISLSNNVTIKIDLQQDSLGQSDSSGVPTINKRTSKQNVTVKTGQTIVISGLVQNAELEGFKKIPLLGDIPIIGWLFRNTSVRNIKSNLMIFLTPHVVHGADDLAAIYKAKLAERDEFMRLVYGSDFKENKFYAALPTEQDGEYREEEGDRFEKQVRDQRVRQMMDDRVDAAPDAAPPPPPVEDTTIPIPHVDGGSSSGGGMMDGGDSLPPPPPPPPMAGPDGEDRDDIPPPPEPLPPPEEP